MDVVVGLLDHGDEKDEDKRGDVGEEIAWKK